MAHLIAILLAAAAQPAPAQSEARRAFVPTRAVASAQASVRILPGAKISLSADAETDGYKLNSATITVEDGSQRPAKLVEFQ